MRSLARGGACAYSSFEAAATSQSIAFADHPVEVELLEAVDERAFVVRLERLEERVEPQLDAYEAAHPPRVSTLA